MGAGQSGGDVSKRHHWLRGLGCIVGVMLMWGCDPGSRSRDGEDAANVVARVGGREVRAGELDASMRLPLHDLARARYRLRLEALRGLIAQHLAQEREVSLARALGDGEAELLLAPPEPPRVVFEIEGLPIRGASDASVVVTVFCDFDSSACTRVQPALRVLVAEFAGRVRLSHRDFPVSSGADPGGAAAALGCAGGQGALTELHDALYARPGRRDLGGLARLAGALGLDVDRFRACLGEGAEMARVDESVAMGRHLGVRDVPSGFVNGLYVTGAAPVELRRLVVRELERLGLDAEPERLAASDLGLSLVGMVRHRHADESLATIRIAGQGRSHSFRPGETVIADVVLEEVRDDGVVLRRGERTELLPIYRGHSTSRSGLPPARAFAGPDEPEEELPSDDVRVVRLSRDSVELALDRREELESALHPGVVDPEGRVLLEIDAIEPGDLYDLLGLELGDVLMVVDGELIDERENPLWEVLEARSLVELVVGRNGEPQIVEIEID